MLLSFDANRVEVAEGGYHVPAGRLFGEMKHQRGVSRERPERRRAEVRDDQELPGGPRRAQPRGGGGADHVWAPGRRMRGVALRGGAQVSEQFLLDGQRFSKRHLDSTLPRQFTALVVASLVASRLPRRSPSHVADALSPPPVRRACSRVAARARAPRPSRPSPGSRSARSRSLRSSLLVSRPRGFPKRRASRVAAVRAAPGPRPGGGRGGGSRGGDAALREAAEVLNESERLSVAPPGRAEQRRRGPGNVRERASELHERSSRPGVVDPENEGDVADENQPVYRERWAGSDDEDDSAAAARAARVAYGDERRAPNPGNPGNPRATTETGPREENPCPSDAPADEPAPEARRPRGRSRRRRSRRCRSPASPTPRSWTRSPRASTASSPAVGDLGPVGGPRSGRAPPHPPPAAPPPAPTSLEPPARRRGRPPPPHVAVPSDADSKACVCRYTYDRNELERLGEDYALEPFDPEVAALGDVPGAAVADILPSAVRDACRGANPGFDDTVLLQAFDWTSSKRGVVAEGGSSEADESSWKRPPPRPPSDDPARRSRASSRVVALAARASDIAAMGFTHAWLPRPRSPSPPRATSPASSSTSTPARTATRLPSSLCARRSRTRASSRSATWS